MPTHLELGRQAEDQAATFLKAKGLALLYRNFRSPFGEIDLIFRHDQAIVFVEVRYRKSMGFGSPAETVNREKQRKLLATAQYFLQNKPSYQHLPCRFDVVTFAGDLSKVEADWISDAFGQS